MGPIKFGLIWVSWDPISSFFTPFASIFSKYLLCVVYVLTCLPIGAVNSTLNFEVGSLSKMAFKWFCSPGVIYVCFSLLLRPTLSVFCAFWRMYFTAFSLHPISRTVLDFEVLVSKTAPLRNFLQVLFMFLLQFNHFLLDSKWNLWGDKAITSLYKNRNYYLIYLKLFRQRRKCKL